MPGSGGNNDGYDRVANILLLPASVFADVPGSVFHRTRASSSRRRGQPRLFPLLPVRQLAWLQGRI
jgi:hypothetical protein